MQVAISSLVVAQIVAHAASSRNEVCGLLLGVASRVARAVPTANVAVEPQRRFEIEPGALLRAHREARAGAMPVVGHYHSHPSGDAIPSPTDAALAFETGRLWLIVANRRTALFVATEGGRVEGRFEPVALVVED